MNINDKLHFEPKTANSIIKKVGEIEKFQGKWETLKLNDGSFLKELKLIGLIKGNVEGTSVCYCINKENWTAMKTLMTTFLNQDLTANQDCC